MCSVAESLCVCQWKNIVTGEMVILECESETVMMFFAVSHRISPCFCVYLTLLLTQCLMLPENIHLPMIASQVFSTFLLLLLNNFDEIQLKFHLH